MKIRVYLVRHAESLSNTEPLTKEKEDALSDKGVLQAKALASYFVSHPFEALYTSQSIRAKPTADEILKLTDMQYSAYAFLGERKGSFSQDLAFSATEKFITLKKRLIETKGFLERTKHKHVVVISHAIFIKALVAYLVFEEDLNESLLAKINNIIVIENAGVIELVFNKEKEKWRIMSLDNVVSSKN